MDLENIQEDWVSLHLIHRLHDSFQSSQITSPFSRQYKANRSRDQLYPYFQIIIYSQNFKSNIFNFNVIKIFEDGES